MDIIHERQLPPMAGYVEVEIDGIRQYKKVETEQDTQIAALAEENASLQTQLFTLTDTLDTVLSVILPALMG